MTINQVEGCLRGSIVYARPRRAYHCTAGYGGACSNRSCSIRDTYQTQARSSHKPGGSSNQRGILSLVPITSCCECNCPSAKPTQDTPNSPGDKERHEDWSIPVGINQINWIGQNIRIEVETTLMTDWIARNEGASFGIIVSKTVEGQTCGRLHSLPCKTVSALSNANLYWNCRRQQN